MIRRGAYGKYILYIDGVDDYVVIPGFPPINGDITVLWCIFKFRASSNTPFSCFMLYTPDPPGWSWSLVNHYGYTVNRIVYGHGDGIKSYNPTACEFPIEIWHVGGMVRKYPYIYWYVNGVLFRTSNISFCPPPNGTNSTLYIRGWDSHSYYLSQVLIYKDRALSGDEVKRVTFDMLNMRQASIRDGLVLELLPKTSYSNLSVWEDSSGYGNHGTVYGARWVYV